MPKKYFPRTRKKRKPTPRQQQFVKGIAKGKTLTQAALDAGYSPNHPAESGYQALNALRGRMPALLEKHGIGEDTLIQKYLVPLLDAHETKFFPQGITMQVEAKNKKGFVDKLVYTVNVEALGIRHAALRTAFELHGSYAPRDPKEAAQYGVKIIKIDIPRPADTFNQFVDVIPESALTRHGTKPQAPTNGTPTNGKPPKNGDGT
jgi:hypothetical protein